MYGWDKTILDYCIYLMHKLVIFVYKKVESTMKH